MLVHLVQKPGRPHAQLSAAIRYAALSTLRPLLPTTALMPQPTLCFEEPSVAFSTVTTEYLHK